MVISSHNDVTNCGMRYDKVRVFGNAKMTAEVGRFKMATGYAMAIMKRKDTRGYFNA